VAVLQSLRNVGIAKLHRSGTLGEGKSSFGQGRYLIGRRNRTTKTPDTGLDKTVGGFFLRHGWGEGK